MHSLCVRLAVDIARRRCDYRQFFREGVIAGVGIVFCLFVELELCVVKRREADGELDALWFLT